MQSLTSKHFNQKSSLKNLDSALYNLKNIKKIAYRKRWFKKWFRTDTSIVKLLWKTSLAWVKWRNQIKVSAFFCGWWEDNIEMDLVYTNGISKMSSTVVHCYTFLNLFKIIVYFKNISNTVINWKETHTKDILWLSTEPTSK